MSLSALIDKTQIPQECDVAAVLGDTFLVWKQLEKDICERYGPLSAEWAYSSPKTGWGLRLKGKKRAFIYMTPCKGYFLASFVLGEKAVAYSRESGLPASVLTVIEAAPKYAEGRGVRFQVKRPDDLSWLLKVAAAKMKY